MIHRQYSNSAPPSGIFPNPFSAPAFNPLAVFNNLRRPPPEGEPKRKKEKVKEKTAWKLQLFPISARWGDNEARRYDFDRFWESFKKCERKSETFWNSALTILSANNGWPSDVWLWVLQGRKSSELRRHERLWRLHWRRQVEDMGFLKIKPASSARHWLQCICERRSWCSSTLAIRTPHYSSRTSPTFDSTRTILRNSSSGSAILGKNGPPITQPQILILRNLDMCRFAFAALRHEQPEISRTLISDLSLTLFELSGARIASK